MHTVGTCHPRRRVAELRDGVPCWAASPVGLDPVMTQSIAHARRNRRLITNRDDAAKSAEKPAASSATREHAQHLGRPMKQARGSMTGDYRPHPEADIRPSEGVAPDRRSNAHRGVGKSHRLRRQAISRPSISPSSARAMPRPIIPTAQPAAATGRSLLMVGQVRPDRPPLTCATPSNRTSRRSRGSGSSRPGC